MDFLWKENGWKLNYPGLLVLKTYNGYAAFSDKVTAVSNLFKKKITLAIADALYQSSKW